MFVLMANPMRDRFEVLRPVARGSTREALIAFIARERVEHYVDEFPGGHGNELERNYAFHKVFRKGGPLEWFNMPDINAAIGLAQMRKYPGELLPDRKRMFERYRAAFAQDDWAILPSYWDEERESSCHLFMLRVDGADEARRDAIIAHVSAAGVGVNVHYIPMAMLTLFRTRGYDIANYPVTYALYANEITLPLYNGLTDEQIDEVITAIRAAVEATA